LESQYIRGVVDINSELMILLDFNRILLLEEIRRLKKVSMGGEGPKAKAN